MSADTDAAFFMEAVRRDVERRMKMLMRRGGPALKLVDIEAKKLEAVDKALDCLTFGRVRNG